jgi:hypothetical protein
LSGHAACSLLGGVGLVDDGASSRVFFIFLSCELPLELRVRRMIGGSIIL